MPKILIVEDEESIRLPLEDNLRLEGYEVSSATDGRQGFSLAQEKRHDLLVSTMIVESSLCALGGSAPNPVLTTLKYFREEYEAHVKDKKCPAHACRKLIHYIIDPEICLDHGHGCHVCAKNCPDGAIIGETKQAHRIDVTKCGTCGICHDVCKFDAINVE